MKSCPAGKELFANYYCSRLYYFFLHFLYEKMLDIAFNCLQVLHMKHFKFVWLLNTAADGKKLRRENNACLIFHLRKIRHNIPYESLADNSQ